MPADPTTSTVPLDLPLSTPEGTSVELGALLTLAAVGALAESTVEIGAGHRLEQFAALALVGLEEPVELALREQHRAAELVEVEPDGAADEREGVGLAVGVGEFD